MSKFTSFAQRTFAVFGAAALTVALTVSSFSAPHAAVFPGLLV